MHNITTIHPCIVSLYFSLLPFSFSFHSILVAENGDFLALDLGGSNFRVMWVKIKDGKSKACMDVYTIPGEVMRGPGDQVIYD